MAERFTFKAEDAVREHIVLRASICGPTGCGKTKTGLILATRMVETMGLGPLFVIDSENRSALRYARSPRTKRGFDFKHVAMPEDDYSPQAYMRAIDYCEDKGAGVILIDSFSHAWMGLNGALAQVDAAGGASKFSSGWSKVTPIYAKLIQRLQDTAAHMFWTLRAKMHYDIVENEKGKKEPVKMGLTPIAREGIEYEGDLAFDMTVPDNDLIVGKSRCDLLTPGEVFKKPGNDLADILVSWLEDTEPQKEARSYAEALNAFVAAGIAAAASEDRSGWKKAETEFGRWCKAHDITEEKFADGAKDAVRRVREAGPARAVAPTPPSNPKPAAVPTESDEERARRIDAGQA